MYRDINEEIYELEEKLRKKRKLETLKSMDIEELESKKKKLIHLKNSMIKEEKDVLKLENNTLSSLFLDIMGKKRDKIDKEKREYLEAKMRYDDFLLSINELEKEITLCEERLKDYSDIEERYEDAINKKQEMIMINDEIKGEHLREALDKINELDLDIKEVEEAISAGEDVLNYLEKMEEPLNSAQSWGIWDMLGGDLITSVIKHSKIDDANKFSHDVERSLKRFEKELKDVNKFTNISVNIGSFAKFADFFFDGIFSDWFVQSKINESIDSVKNAKSEVESLILDLNRNRINMEREKEEKDEIINKLLKS